MTDEEFLATFLRAEEVDWPIIETLSYDEALSVAARLRALGWYGFANQVVTEAFTSGRA